MSDVIKIVVNDRILIIEDAVAPLLDIIKLLTIETGDMNNNKEVDIEDILEDVNTSAPIPVELPNYLHSTAAKVLPLDTGAVFPDDSDDDQHLPHDVSGHAHQLISSSISSSSSMSYSSSTISSDFTSDSDCVMIQDDVADVGFLTRADLQCPECGQQVPRPHDVPLPRPNVYSLTWTEDDDSGLLGVTTKRHLVLLPWTRPSLPRLMTSRRAPRR